MNGFRMQNNKIKFSIIVPVYNVEKYLPKCLDSLVNQTYKNLEIICVNDGSTDNSLQVLNEYAQKDSRVKLINQKNKGVSVARNVGIDNATGEYIMFVDSDDWLELNACELLYQHLIQEPQIDILQFRYKRITNKGIIYPTQNACVHVINSNDLVSELLSENITVFCWDKCFKLEFLKQNEIYYTSGIEAFEDYLFVAVCYSHSANVKILEAYLYNYYDNKNSVCHKDAYNRLLMNQKAVRCISNLIDIELNKDLYEFSYGYYLYMINLLARELYYTKYKSEYLKELHYARSLVTNNDSKAVKLYNFNLMLFNYHIAWLYWKIIRPIGKYCIVLPYRRIKSFMRSKRNGA